MVQRLPRALKLNEADVTLERDERKLLASIEPVTMSGKAEANVKSAALVSRF
jgi:virulence-associated protein VagC